MKSTEAPKDNGGGGYGVFFFFVLLRSRKVRNALPRALIFFLV